MASKKEQEQTTLDALNNNLTNVGRQIEVNKKAIYVAFGAIILIAAITFGYLYLYRAPRQNKAMEAYNKVETVAMGNDSLAAAEYKKVADAYGSTDAGRLAALSAAEAYYNLGKYNEALKYLKDFSCGDPVLDANAMILLGDCYVNLKKYNEAIDAFSTAVKDAEGNPQIAPRALLKKAVVFDEQKQYAKALECYEVIKKDFPTFHLGNGMDLDAYIEREKARLGK